MRNKDYSLVFQIYTLSMLKTNHLGKNMTNKLLLGVKSRYQCLKLSKQNRILNVIKRILNKGIY